jgi:hypothetical protein
MCASRSRRVTKLHRPYPGSVVFMTGSDYVVFGGLFLVVVAITGLLAWRRRQRETHWPGLRQTVATFFAVGAATMLLIQLIPYGRSHDNPAVVAEPAWDTPKTRELTVRACYDCHSNETQYPWYTNVAPISWSLALHIDEGRQKLNFSEWNRRQEEADEAAETVKEGSMPLWSYELLHSDARLDADERRALIDGLTATLGSERDD